jgi:hypothetical protein
VINEKYKIRYLSKTSVFGKTALILLVFIFLTPAWNIYSFDLISHPEAAEENAVFFNTSIVSYEPPPNTWNITAPKFKFSLDYVFPWPLPFFIGFYMEAPDPNLTSFGIRTGYHLNMEIDNLDMYFMYCFDFGFLRARRLKAYGVSAPEIRYFDFRAGLRYIFGKLFGLYIESDYKLDALIMGVSIKLN